MKRIAEAKQKYENIPIPDALSERVAEEIEKSRKSLNQKAIHAGRHSFMKKTAAAVTAAAVLVTAGVNTSEVFARELGGVPVIGPIARVLTFRSYETETEAAHISVDIPSITLISADLAGLENGVNKEVYRFCEEYAADAMERAEEYRQAFLGTGGTEEEWAAHDVKIKVWYEIKAFTDDYLSIAVMGTDSWSGAGAETKYYSFGIKEGKWLSLTDLLDADSIPAAEESIRSQIAQREAESGMDFWDEDWEGINEDTKFYINAAGNPVIVFEKYEIAPGAAGIQEFEIA